MPQEPTSGNKPPKQPSKKDKETIDLDQASKNWDNLGSDAQLKALESQKKGLKAHLTDIQKLKENTDAINTDDIQVLNDYAFDEYGNAKQCLFINPSLTNFYSYSVCGDEVN